MDYFVINNLKNTEKNLQAGENVNKLFGYLYYAETVFFNKKILANDRNKHETIYSETNSFWARVSVGECEKTLFVFSRAM